MASPRFKTPYNLDPDRERGEVNDDVSLTVPDQTLGIKEILYRYAQGMPLDEYQRRVTYGDEIDQSDDDFDVHPANTFNHDLLDLVPAGDNAEYSPSEVQSNVTTINDDAKEVTKEGEAAGA